MSIAVYKLDEPQNKIVVIIGLGLIGNEIAKFTSKLPSSSLLYVMDDVDWALPVNIVNWVKAILKFEQNSNIEIVWSAGKSGFSATSQELSREYKTYEHVMRGLYSHLKTRVTVNFISSAGGLYEKNSFVTSLDEISPIRAYAYNKRDQELLLTELRVNHRIYRISSVYGMGHNKSRRGLINEMIKNSYLVKSINIYANQNTLRDYVYNSDIAKFIVDEIAYNGNYGIKLLASGRPTSINMLINLIKKATGRQLKINYRANESNSRDITFSSCLIDPRFKRTSLEEGISTLHMLVRSSEKHRIKQQNAAILSTNLTK